MDQLFSNSLWTEAIVVGLVLVVVGNLVSLFLGKMLPSPVAEEHQEACRAWNKYYIMEVSLFLTGLVAHLVLEYIGVNNWYCKYGTACLAK